MRWKRVVMASAIVAGLAGAAVASPLIYELATWPIAPGEGDVQTRRAEMETMKTCRTQVRRWIRAGDRTHKTQALDCLDTIILLGKNIPDAFADPSQVHNSRALPAVWRDTERFRALTLEMEAKAMRLRTGIAQDEPDLVQPYTDLHQACTACHHSFRVRRPTVLSFIERLQG